MDAETDVGPELDAGVDVAPALDTGLPADATMPCGEDGGGPVEVAYALGNTGVLYRYDPVRAKATALGTPNCPNDNVQWTMTASRENAYIPYTDGTLYAVDLASLACSQTPFQVGQLGIEPDYALAVANIGGTEKLYVYGETSPGSGPILAVSDLSTFVLTEVAAVSPMPPPATYPVNLTADTLGHLYAFSPGGWIQQIDAATGKVLKSEQTNVTTDGTWATLTYGAELLLWVGTHVDRVNLMTGMKVSDRDVGVAAVGAASFIPCP
jgi:hypothetical protein